MVLTGCSGTKPVGSDAVREPSVCMPAEMVLYDCGESSATWWCLGPDV